MMCRRLFPILAAASFLLCVSISILWWMSFDSAITVRQIDETQSVTVTRGELNEWKRQAVQYPGGIFMDYQVRWAFPLWPIILTLSVLPVTWVILHRRK